jgi:hypothetical protein
MISEDTNKLEKKITEHFYQLKNKIYYMDEFDKKQQLNNSLKKICELWDEDNKN